jgi:hypothetical protein
MLAHTCAVESAPSRKGARTTSQAPFERKREGKPTAAQKATSLSGELNGWMRQPYHFQYRWIYGISVLIETVCLYWVLPP